MISTNVFADTKLISNQIASLTAKQSPDQLKIARSIHKYCLMYKIDSKLVLGLIMTESSFNQKAVSSTQDYGIGQINYKIWSKEFKRLNREPLDLKRLKTDSDYAIKRTVEILSILRDSKDPYWIGKYHSKTAKLKKAYYNRIVKNLSSLENKKIYVASK